MLKNLMLFFSLFFLILLQNLFTNELTVSTIVPSNVIPGEEIIVEVKVSKGEIIEGFAKLQQELPEGFTATSFENKGASFTFSDQKVKFIWISLPSEEEFSIKYKVQIPQDQSGAKTISGSFHYLERNDKKVYDIPIVTIHIGEELSDQMPDQNKDESTAMAREKNETSENSEDGNENSSSEKTVNPFIPAEVNCKREIDFSAVPSGEFLIEIMIKKDDLTGFAKLQDVLPKGLTATSVETKNASFSFTDQKVKFVWMSLPPQNEFKVSYKVKIGPDISGNLFINGEFSYVEKDGETQKCILPQDAVNIIPEEDATADAQIKPKGEKPAEKSEEESMNKARKETAKKKESKPANTIPPPQKGGVAYRVQIAAGPNVVGPEYFRKKYNFTENVYTELHEGLNKYTTGGFEVYKSARDNREIITTSHPIDTGPFVTAYNNGQRITVQEALMITNQKWVK